jgi:hypothetical protein
VEKTRFHDTWLQLACLLFGLHGLGWVLWGSFDPLGAWDGLAADALFEGRTPPEVIRFRRFILGPFGATSAGYFFLLFFVLRYPFQRRERWAYRAVVGSLSLWFVVDSTASVLHGALFNVLLVNVPCITVLGLPLFLLRSRFRPPVANLPGARLSSPRCR